MSNLPEKGKATEKISKSVHAVTDPITTPIKKVQKNFLRHIPKIILYPLELFILILIILFFFIQTNTFNRWALNFTLNKVNTSLSEKESSIYAESLRGNVFAGIRLMKAGITVGSDTLIKFDTLLVRYDIFSLLKNKIVIRQLTMQNPQSSISKLADKEGNIIWNFEYLLKKEKVEEDTAKKPFNWGIEVENLIIHNGNFRILDSNLTKNALSRVKVQPSNNFNFQNLDLTNFELSLEARYYPDFKSVNVRNLSFNTNSDFKLNKLAFNAVLSPKDSITEIKNLELITSRSEISAPLILMTGFNPLDSVNYFNFKNNNVRLELHAKKFNMLDLIYFLPNLNFLNGIASLDLEADGKYSDLNIKDFKLKTPESSVNFKGKIMNLNDPGKLSFDLSGKDLVLDPSETKTLLPGIPIPDYGYIGKVNLDITYTGEPTDFSSVFNIRSAMGNAEGNLSLDLANHDNSYKADFQTSNLNLGGILKNKDLESSINLKANISGNGFDLNRMSAKVNYEINNSHVYNVNVNKSAGLIEIDNKNISADLSLLTDEIETSLKGKLNLNNLADAEYSMKGRTHNFDLSKFTKSSSNKSNLNFAFDINGKGASLDNVEGTYNLNLQNSLYSSYFIPATPVDINISRTKLNTNLDVTSRFFDMKAKGNFELADIADVTMYHVNLLVNEFVNKLTHDSAEVVLTSSVQHKVFHDFDFEYSFITKDIKPLTRLFDSAGIKFEGEIKGKMSNSASVFKSVTDINVTNFNYLDSIFLLKNIKGYINLDDNYSKINLKPYDELYPVTADINIKGDRVRISSTSFDSLSLKINLENSNQAFKIRGGLDSTFIVDLAGTSYINNWMHVTFDSLFIRYNKFLISNEGKLIVIYNPAFDNRTITFQQFNINNNLMQFSMKGGLSLAGKSNFDVEAKSIKVGEIMDLLFPPDTSGNKYAESKYKNPIKGTIRRVSIHYEGDKTDPIVGFEMNSDLLRYEDNKIGRIDAFIDYSKNVLSTDVLISNALGNGRFRLNGDIPFINPFSKGVSRDSVSISNSPVNFTLKADNFQIDFFSELIPHLADLKGVLNGEIDAKGTVEQPVLNGGLNIEHGRFLFGVTGLYHRFDAKILAENSNLVVQNFSVYNIGDNVHHLDFYGQINFEGLNIKNIDLSSAGDVYVLDETANENDFGMTGTLLLGSGNPALRIHGDLEKLYVDGQLLIKSANIAFASVPSSPYDISADNFSYRMIIDSSGKGFKDTVIVVPPEKFGEVDPFLRKYIISSSEPTKNANTNFIYNIEVNTEKNAVVSIVFNPITGEELYGEMQASLNLTNTNGDKLHVTGNVDIVGDSYYRFYRVFKVNDSHLIFRGPPDNPDLNINAVYEYKTSSGQFISSEEQGVKIILQIKGTKRKPELTLKLYENGVEQTASDAQSDAISYLIFGVAKSSLPGVQQTALLRNFGTSTGSNVLSSLLGNAVRDIVPFIQNAELNYSEGNIVTGTDVRLTSAFGDAIVKVGGKVFAGIENTEVDIEYPLNKLLNMGFTNNLVLEFSRTIDETGLNGGRSVYTGLKLSYQLKY